MIEFELPDYLPEPPPQPVDPEIRIADETQVEALKNDFIARQQEVLYTSPEALFRLEGDAAIAGGAAAAAQLAEARDALLDRAVNPAQHAILSRSLDQHLVLAGESIQRHTKRQRLTWQRRVAQDRLDLLRQQVGLDHSDRGLLEGYARAGESAAMDQARIDGLLPESNEAKQSAAGARSSLYRSAIEGALAAGNHEAASTLYDHARDKLTPVDAASIEPELKLARELRTARNYLTQVTPISSQEPPAYFDAPQLMGEAEAAHESATRQNETDWADNPIQRATNQHLIDVQFGKRKRSIEEAKDQLDGAVMSWLAQSTPDGQLQVSRPPPALWTRLSPERQQAVDAVLAQNARGQEFLLAAFSRNQPVEDTILSDADPDRLEDGRQYAQAGAGRPSRRGGRDLTPSETLRILSFQSRLEAIRKLEPNNPHLTNLTAPGWIPSNEAINRLDRELLNAQRRVNTARGMTSDARILSELGLPRNTQKVYSPKGASIPDALTDTRSIEIKDRAYVSLTRQLQIQAEAAKESGRIPTLITGEWTSN